MAKDTKISPPSSMGGIVRYFDESTSKILISPQTVVIVIAVIIVLMGIVLPLITLNR